MSIKSQPSRLASSVPRRRKSPLRPAPVRSFDRGRQLAVGGIALLVVLTLISVLWSRSGSPTSEPAPVLPEPTSTENVHLSQALPKPTLEPREPAAERPPVNQRLYGKKLRVCHSFLHL